MTEMAGTEMPIPGQPAMDEAIGVQIEKNNRLKSDSKKRATITDIANRMREIGKILISMGKSSQCLIYPIACGMPGFPRLSLKRVKSENRIHGDIYLTPASLLNNFGRPLNMAISDLKDADMETLNSILTVLSKKEWQQFS